MLAGRSALAPAARRGRQDTLRYIRTTRRTFGQQSCFRRSPGHRRYYSLAFRREVYFKLIKMYRMTIVLVLLVALGACTAQLNFSTGWGKRAPGGSASPSADNCKSATDATVMLLYKIIQAEAQKLVDCERYAK